MLTKLAKIPSRGVGRFTPDGHTREAVVPRGNRIPDRTPVWVSYRRRRRPPGSHKPRVGGSIPPTATTPQARISSPGAVFLMSGPPGLLGWIGIG
jgi:hypothetical protein